MLFQTQMSFRTSCSVATGFRASCTVSHLMLRTEGPFSVMQTVATVFGPFVAHSGNNDKHFQKRIPRLTRRRY